MAEREPAVPHPGRRSAQDGVGLLLAGGMCLLPFLVPYHELPLRSFYSEWLAGALGVLAFVVMLAGRGAPRVSVPHPARWLVAFALFLAACAVAGDSVYPQMPLWGVVYLLYAVMMMWLGAELVAASGIERTVSVMAGFILTGALANALAGVIQFYGRPSWLEDIVADFGGLRAYGNIAQPNLYANYLALGEAALLFLWGRARIGGTATGCAAMLLVWAGALSASRSAVLYAVVFALLGALGAGGQRGQRGGELPRLTLAACALAIAVLLAYYAVPWFNDLLGLGPTEREPFRHLLDALGDVRWQAWTLALRMFADAPVFGVGIGRFAGEAFATGLPSGMAATFQIWTSPHNLLLHLMAETGVIGLLLVCGALGTWSWSATWRYVRSPVAPQWWVLSVAGVELIHSMLEYPMWRAHFLGVTALMMGMLAFSPECRAAAAWRFRVAAAAAGAVFAAILALTLRDYLRLDLTRLTGTARSLILAGAGPSRDVHTLDMLGRGPLAPLAELWMCLGTRLDREDLDAKLKLSERVMRYWPSGAVAARRAVFLLLAGWTAEADELIDRVSRMSPEAKRAAVRVLRLAEGADPAAVDRLVARIGLSGSGDPTHHPIGQ